MHEWQCTARICLYRYCWPNAAASNLMASPVVLTLSIGLQAPPPHPRPRNDADAAKLFWVRRRAICAAPLLSQALSVTCATKQQHREKNDAAKHLSATNSCGYCSSWGTMVYGQSCNARTQPLLLAAAVVWRPVAQQWMWKSGHFLTSIAVSWSLHKNPNLENNF